MNKANFPGIVNGRSASGNILVFHSRVAVEMGYWGERGKQGGGLIVDSRNQDIIYGDCK